MSETEDPIDASIYRRHRGAQWDNVSSNKVRHEQKRKSE